MAAKLTEKIGYGFGDLSSSMFWKIFIYYLPFFYSNVFGLRLQDATLLVLVTKLWDAISDPMMGVLADRTQTRWGKYRPYLLWIALPFAIAGILTFTTPDWGYAGKLVWAYVTYILMMTVYTAINVPYGATLGVMSADSTERTTFSSFRMFFAYGGSFVARAGILTGRDHLRTGAMFVTRSSENMVSREQTIAEVFKANDYATGCYGKWHNGAHYPQDPNGQGFDEFVGFCAGHLTNYFDYRLQHNQEFYNAEGYISDVLTDRAIDFMRQSTDGDTPFFCYVPYNAPHAPYQVPDEYYDKYRHIVESHGDEAAATYAMCDNLDTNIGRLLNYITESGVEKNTIIIFMSDNGPHGARYNSGMRGVKGEPYEGGFKVPYLVYWNGHIEAMELPQTASYVDIMPTILDLCGIASRPVDGREITGISLKPLLLGEKSELEERHLFTHRSNTDRTLLPNNGVVYTATHKLITLGGGNRELYNKIEDPTEKNNLIESEPQLAEQLSQVYDAWFADATVEYERSISCTATTTEPSHITIDRDATPLTVNLYNNLHKTAS